MTSADSDMSHDSGTSECVKYENYRTRMQKLEQVLTEKEDEILYAYRLHLDDIFIIKQLEDALSRVHSDTNRGKKIE